MILDKQFDLLIIGGGIIGAMTAALAIIRQPGISMAIIDKNLAGLGATAYSAALSTPLAKSMISQDLINCSKAVIQEIEREIKLSLITMPAIYAVDEQNLDRFYNLYIGSDLKIIDDSFIRTSLGNIHVSPNKKLLLSESDAHSVNLGDLLNKIYLFLRQNSCVVYESCKVCDIITKENGSTVVCDHLQLSANKIIISIGPWAYNSHLRKHSNQSFPNKKITALHLNQLPEAQDPIIVSVDDDAFLLPLHARGHWLFSIRSNEWDVSPEDEMKISNNDLIIARNTLDKFNLDLDSLFIGGRVFCDSYSDNKELSLDNINKNTLMVSGASGSGYRFSYGIADKILKMINT